MLPGFRKRLCVVVTMFVLNICLSCSSFASILVFDSAECDQCVYLRNEIFQPAQKKYPKLNIIYYDLKYPENYQLLLKCRQESGRTGFVDISNLPIVFIGEKMLAGKEDIEVNFKEAVNNYLLSKTTIKRNSETELITHKVANVYLAYFYEPGCEKCGMLEYMLKYLETKYSGLIVKKYNIWKKQNRKLAAAICTFLNVPEDLRLITPAIFIGNDFVIKAIDPVIVEGLVTKYSRMENIPVWEQVTGFEGAAASEAVHKFNTFGIPIILGSGLLDGINPCAFGIVIFLIIHLTTLKRTRKEVLAAGISFISAVYLSYFSMGIGLYEFLSSSFILLFKKTIYIGGAVLCLILGIYSLMDYFIWKKMGIKKIRLQLPEVFKKKAYSTIIEETRTRNIFIAAFLSGIVISLAEVVCTGQIYLPTILFVVTMSHLKMKGIFYLAIYNLAFIVPLLIVFTAVYKLVSTESLIKKMESNIGRIKILFAILFFAFSFILWIYSGLRLR